MSTPPFIIRQWGRCHYVQVWQAMQSFTQNRDSEVPDEIWCAEHYPIYTLGQRVIIEDTIQHDSSIPMIRTDRGGRITYHGPGQLLIYPLLNLSRLKWNLRDLVSSLEQTTIQLLKAYGIIAYAKREAPGVYIEGKKLASVGLRIRKGYCYHGIAINVNMDLSPFKAIHPCGFQALSMTQLIDWIGDIAMEEVADQFLDYWSQQTWCR